MRVISKPQPDSMREYTLRCKCDAQLAVTVRDAKRTESDRDGVAYVFVCPCCKADIWVDVRVLQKTARRHVED